MSTPLFKHYIHGCYKETDNVSVAIFKERTVIKNDDESISYKDKLVFKPNPKRSVWITKPQFRTHKGKREYSRMEELDRYVVEQRNVAKVINDALGNFTSGRGRYRNDIRGACKSPYVYGADVDIETLIKIHYQKSENKSVAIKYTKGALDIEQDVTITKQINVITYIHEKEVYTAFLDSFFYYNKDGERVPADVSQLNMLMRTHIGKHLNEYGFNVNFYQAKTELDLIMYIFNKIHYHKTDFIGIWNMGYDIPTIIERLEFLGADPARIMSHPDVPNEYTFAQFKMDNKKVDHFTDKWHVFNCASYSAFIDKQALYSRLRKVKGRESSYSLDAISKKRLKEGKLTFGETITDHYYMQYNRFPEYIIYNIVDVILLMLLEWKDNDMTTMVRLLGPSGIKDFAKQTNQLRNVFYRYCLNHNCVSATASSDMTEEFDHLIPAVGGTVLPPERAIGISLKALITHPNLETLINTHAADIDVSSMYPTTEIAFNISKETKLLTTVGIEGKPQASIEFLYSRLHSPVENAVCICHEFFNLPNYEEMDALFNAHMTEKLRSTEISNEDSYSNAA